jgi:hypothetical protein
MNTTHFEKTDYVAYVGQALRRGQSYESPIRVVIVEPRIEYSYDAKSPLARYDAERRQASLRACEANVIAGSEF